jgi:polar amino acid transport system ATP-binding protein
MIKAVNVSKTFGELKALRSVSIDVEQKEVVCIIGPSGAGKSTFLHCLKWLEQIDDGQIYIEDKLLFDCANGIDRVKMPPAERAAALLEAGLVFQRFNLFPHKTVLENVTLAPIHVRKIPKKTAKEKAETILARVGLAGKMANFPGQLSGGQQQRVAIARALAMEPKIMLFDEPISALDPELAGEILFIMNNLVASGMTMLIVTHELSFAHKIADRIVFMHEGAILETGKPDDFFTNPKTERARQFLQSAFPAARVGASGTADIPRANGAITWRQ